jgi:hypothetical protein
VGTNAALRAQAARECLTCPTLDACRRAVDADPTLRFGVVAGVDYGEPVRKPTQTAAEVKECAWCGNKIELLSNKRRSDWAKQRFCSRRCTGEAKKARAGLPDAKVCVGCGVKFPRPEGRGAAQWRVQEFCSLQCAARSRAA